MALFNLSERIKLFKSKIKSARTKTQVDRLCKNEYKYLKGQGYEDATISKFFSQYRKVILPLYKPTSNKYIWLNGTKEAALIKRKIMIRGLLIPLKAQSKIKARQAENKERIGKKSSTIRVAQENKTLDDELLTVQNFGKYHKKAVSLINNSNNWQGVAVGLLALTGRRSTEILKTAIFTDIGKTHKLHFEGQLKKKDGKKTDYEIITLCDSSLIITALARLRRLKNCEGMENETIHRNTSKTLNRAVKKHFKTITGLDSITAHDLRRIYAEVAYQRSKLKGESKDKIYMYASYLGHYDIDENKFTQSTENASWSYVKFQLDNEGKEYIKSNLL